MAGPQETGDKDQRGFALTTALVIRSLTASAHLSRVSRSTCAGAIFDAGCRTSLTSDAGTAKEEQGN